MLIHNISDFNANAINFHPTTPHGDHKCSYAGNPLTPIWFQFNATVQFDHKQNSKLVLKTDSNTMAKFADMDDRFKRKHTSNNNAYNPIVIKPNNGPQVVCFKLSKYIKDYSFNPNDEADNPEIVCGYEKIGRGARVRCIATIVKYYNSQTIGAGYYIRIGRIKQINMDPEMETHPIPNFLE